MASSAPEDVLTVGDGNFSFSLAFLRKYGARARLVASSFDSFDELVTKYPESARVCAQLRSLGASVLHRVDATNLQASLALAVGDSADATELRERRFDRIVFNHPHCGEENVARHQSLLSHFFVAAQRLLKPGSGRIHLTLAEGQPGRWEARERAAKAGLLIVEEVDDLDAHEEYGVPYDRKRHQNGKSFHRVLLHGEHREQTSTLFILAPASEVESTPAASSASEASRKRKLSEGRPSASGDPVAPFVCEPCDKTFKTVQGLKTHVHMIHELGVAGTTLKQAKTQLPCGQCERSFKNEEARRQHQISKHGDDASIRPDWFRPLAIPAVDTSGARVCSICDQKFPDEASFNAHWQELQPKASARRVCRLCDKAFEEERALRQHQNFCRARVGGMTR